MKFIQTLPYKPQCSNGVSCVSTPDGGFLYLGGRSVNFVMPAENPLIKTFYIKVQATAVDFDPCWNNAEAKLFATLDSEKSILIWDFDKGVAISGHKSHCHKQSEGLEKSISLVHISYLKNRNLLSIDSNNLVVYCASSNSVCILPKFAPGKGQIVTALKCSPYKENIFALGTNRGQVYICDLQKMAVLFTLGRHQHVVSSLSWNLMDSNPETPKACKILKPPLLSNRAIEENDDIFNIYDYDYLENEFGAPIKSTNLENDDDDEEIITKTNEASLDPNFDFQEACESLKREINAVHNTTTIDSQLVECDAVTLDDCRNSKNAASCLSSMDEDGSLESTEGSLEFVDRSSSSDENRHVDGKQLEEQMCEAKHGETVAEVCQEKVAPDADKEENDIVLASASNDCQVWVWNAKNGGLCDNLQISERKIFKGSPSLQIFWRNSSELYAIDAQGEIIRWMLSSKISPSSKSKRSYKFERVPSDFAGIKVVAFGISKNSDLLWYISSKLEIVCKNIETAETILHYATATSGIYMARESPENNSKIALTFADRRIGILDISQLSSNKAAIRYLDTKLNTFARSLAWNSDGCKIAFGTIDGQVGYVNIDTFKSNTFHTIYGRPVYSIVWNGANQIFVICNDKLFAYRIGKIEPLTIEGVSNGVSTVSVRGNFLFLGNVRGYIEIYSGEKNLEMPNSHVLTFELTQSVQVGRRYVMEIAWNPINPNEFAAVTNEAFVEVLSFNASERKATQLRRIEIGKSKATVSSVKWSNRDPQKLITSGLDGALRVFDLNRPSNEEQVFLKQFHCPLFSAMLLPRDEKYALCTGKTITVEIVDTTNSDDITEMLKANGTLDNIKWASKMNIGNATVGNKRKDKSNAKSTTMKTEPVVKEELAVANDIAEKIAELSLEKLEKKEKEDIKKVVANSNDFLKTPQTLMNLITKEHNKNPLQNINKILNPDLSEEKEDPPVLISKLFGNKKDAEMVLNAELEKIKTQTTLAQLGCTFMSQVKGDVKSVILNAIQSRELNEWHIALAPTVSYSFWQKCCEAFAEQLLEQGYGLQAATYMLALHNQREAIDILMNSKFFKEALLIGRVYLHENDPLIDEIINKWIEDLENHGNLPGAALICAVSEQYMRGYEILSKQRVLGPEETCIIKLLKEKEVTVT